MVEATIFERGEHTRRLCVTAHQVIIIEVCLYLEIVNIRTRHDLQESIVRNVIGKLLRVVSILTSFDQNVKLLCELLEEVDIGVLTPHSLERLELHDELPLRVKHLALGFNECPPVVLVPTIEYRRGFVVDAS